MLALATVHDGNQLSEGCFDKLCIGLRLLRQLGSHEPVRSTSAAVEQMISRIQTLRPELAPSTVPVRHNSDTFTVTGEATQQGNLFESPNALIGAFDSTIPALTPAGWENELLLDDLWSAMDWNVGFPPMDASSAILPDIGPPAN